jgi:mannose-1-phosphate guanylyltransferase (GDP) (EC 2.7.7.22)
MKGRSFAMTEKIITLQKNYKMNNNNYIIIMAGGVGSRFWPMSTEEKPKQFLDVLGIGKSLLQQTVARFQTIAPAENILIVTSAKYKALVAEQCPELLESNILLEPCMRNTAPCIAYAAYKIKASNASANIVVAPSDHLITNETEFIRIIENGLDFTANNDELLTLGIQPHRPETGYGYIQASPSINNEQLIINNKEGVHIGSEGQSYETMPNAENGAQADFPPLGGTEGVCVGFLPSKKSQT